MITIEDTPIYLAILSLTSIIWGFVGYYYTVFKYRDHCQCGGHFYINHAFSTNTTNGIMFGIGIGLMLCGVYYDIYYK